MATYINDLRLKEISTGDESGTWGTSTNTNLELIGEALGYATQQVFGSDADATTTLRMVRLTLLERCTLRSRLREA